MLNPRNLPAGQEQHESYRDKVTKRQLVQYDYRHTNGKLFSCVKPTLEQCQMAKDKWLQK